MLIVKLLLLITIFCKINNVETLEEITNVEIKADNNKYMRYYCKICKSTPLNNAKYYSNLTYL